MVIFFLKEKSEAIIYLKQLFTMIQQELQVDIQRIKTDLGGEFNSKQFQDYTQEKGIIHKFSAAYTSEQNGYIERNNRTIVEATRSMLHSRNLPLNLWAKAAKLLYLFGIAPSTNIIRMPHHTNSSSTRFRTYLFSELSGVMLICMFQSHREKS